MEQLKAGHLACGKRAFFLTFQVIFLWIPRVFSPLSRVFPHLSRVFSHHSRVFPHLSRNKTAASYCRYWIFWPVENHYKGIYKGITKFSTKLHARARPTGDSSHCWQLESRRNQVLNQEFSQSPLLGGKDARYARPPGPASGPRNRALARFLTLGRGACCPPLSKRPYGPFCPTRPPRGLRPPQAAPPPASQSVQKKRPFSLRAFLW